MSLHNIAKELAAKGRNGDTTLVHMSRDEVKGLAALAKANGDTLTINPETGLPEAFKLGKVLKAAVPIAAGFALGPAGFGVFSSALGAGLAVGGAYTLATGSLEKGLMAGLGAYGGAGLGGAAAGAGGAGTAGAAGATGASAATPTAAQLTAPSLSSVGSTANMAGASNALASGSSLVPAGAGSSFGLGATGAANTGLALSPAATMASTAPGIAGTAPAILPSGATAGGSGIMSTAKNFLVQNPGKAAFALGVPLASAAGLFDQPGVRAPEADKGMIRPYQFERTQRPEAYARAPRDSSEQMYFQDKFTPLPAYQAADGGQVPNLNRMPAGGLATLESARDGYGAAQTVDGNIPQFANGGISTLGGYSDGGRLLKGPGDGVSDSIPATINEKQPARLADGEFVVPARIVSELGNGSTDAGAKRLYAMMDRVEKHRRKSVGKGKIATDTKAYKALPA